MRFTLIILGCFVSSSVFAASNIYKCVEPSGKKDYQSSPCAVGFINSTLNITTGGSINLDEKKQQQELKQKEEQAKFDTQKLTKQQELEKQANVDKVAIAESESNQSLIKSNPTKYSAFAIPPYAPDKLSELVKNYRDRLDAVERLRRVAAEKALASNQCGRVESSELDAKSTKTMLTFVVNCSSSKVFSFTEQDLKN